jgi:uncharacterized membrane protein YccF (DUF307 family)
VDPMRRGGTFVNFMCVLVGGLWVGLGWYVVSDI